MLRNIFAGPSRRFRRVCEHIQNLMLGPRGDALSQRKISTDSSSSYTSECGASPTHSISVTRTDCDDDVIMSFFCAFYLCQGTKLDVNYVHVASIYCRGIRFCTSLWHNSKNIWCISLKLHQGEFIRTITPFCAIPVSILHAGF